jgi:hypothetical protein
LRALVGRATNGKLGDPARAASGWDSYVSLICVPGQGKFAIDFQQRNAVNEKKSFRDTSDVIEDCRRNLEVFKGCPGYVMMDRHNIAPGTPIENLNAMTEAAQQSRK